MKVAGVMGDKKKPDGNSTGFYIPKIKRSTSQEVLRTVQVGSRDAQDLMKEFDRSFFDAKYKDRWKLTRVQLVDNSALEMDYRKKRAELKDSGRNARELLELLGCVSLKGTNFAVGVAKEGLHVKLQAKHYLGDCKLGVHVCKHADLVLRSCEGFMSAHVVVFKITPGRCKAVVSNKSCRLEPTPNFDCHVSSIQPKPTDSLSDQLSRSQIYLYEYDENAMPSKRPRHCLPYAVLRFELKRPAESQQTSHLSANPNFISPSAASAGWASSRFIVPESRTQVQETSCKTSKRVTKTAAAERQPNSKSTPLKTTHIPVGDKLLQSPSYQDELVHHGGGGKNHIAHASLNSGQGNPVQERQEVTQACDAGTDTFSQTGRVQERTKETISTTYHTAVCSKRDPRLKRHISDELGGSSNAEEISTPSTPFNWNNFQKPGAESSGPSFCFIAEPKQQQNPSDYSKISLPTDGVPHYRDSGCADFSDKSGNSEVDVRDGNDMTTQNFKSPIEDMIKKVNKLFGRGEPTSDDVGDFSLTKRNSSGHGDLEETDDGHPFNSWGLTWKGHFTDKELSGPRISPQNLEKTGKLLNSKQGAAMGSTLKSFGDKQCVIPANTGPILTACSLLSLDGPSRKAFVAAEEVKRKEVQAVESVVFGQTGKTTPRSHDLAPDFVAIGNCISSNQKFLASCNTTVAERSSTCQEILKSQQINEKIQRSLSNTQRKLASMGQLAVTNPISAGKIDTQVEKGQKHGLNVKVSGLPSEESHNSIAATLKPLLKKPSFNLAGKKERKKLSFSDYKQMRKKATQEQKLSQDEEQEIHKAKHVVAHKVSEVSVSNLSTGQETSALIQEAKTTQNAFELLKSFTQNVQRSLGLFSAWKDAGESGGVDVKTGEAEVKQREGESEGETSLSHLQDLSCEARSESAVGSCGIKSKPLIKEGSKDLGLLTNREEKNSTWSQDKRKDVITDEEKQKTGTNMSGFADPRQSKLSASDSTSRHRSGSDPGWLAYIFSEENSMNASKDMHKLKAVMSVTNARSLEEIRWKETEQIGSKCEVTGSDIGSDQHANSKNCSVNPTSSAHLAHSDISVTSDMMVMPYKPKQPTNPPTVEVLLKDGLEVGNNDPEVCVKPSLHSMGRDADTKADDTQHETTLLQPFSSDFEVMQKDRLNEKGQQAYSIIGKTPDILDSCNVILEKASVPSSLTENISKRLGSYSDAACCGKSGAITNTSEAFDHGVTEKQSIFQCTSSPDGNQNSGEHKAAEQGQKKRKRCRTSAQNSLSVAKDKKYEEAMVRLAKGLRPRGFIHVGGLGKNPTDDPLPVLEGRARMKKSGDKPKSIGLSSKSCNLKKGNENDLASCRKQEHLRVHDKSKKKQGKETSVFKKNQKKRMNIQNIVRGHAYSSDYKDINVSDPQFNDPVDFSIPVQCRMTPCLAPSSQHKHVCEDVIEKEEGRVSSYNWSGDENPDKVKPIASASSLGISSWTDALVKPSLQPQVLLVDLVKAYLKGADFDNCKICQKVIDLSLVEKEDPENPLEPPDPLLLSPPPCLPDLGPVPLMSQTDSTPFLEGGHITIKNTLDSKEMTGMTMEAGTPDEVVCSDSAATYIHVLQGKEESSYFDVSGGGSSEILQAASSEGSPGNLQAASSGGNPGTLQSAISGGSPGTLQAASSGGSPGTLQAASSGGSPGTLQSAISGGSPGTLQAASSGGSPGTLQPASSGGSPGNLQAASSEGSPGTLQAARSGGSPGTLQGASSGGNPGTLQASANGILEAPALLVQENGQTGTTLSGSLSVLSLSPCTKNSDPLCTDIKNGQTGTTSSATLAVMSVSPSTRDADSLYADTDGFWFAPAEASLDINEQSPVAEVDSMMDMPRSFSYNVEKASQVSCKVPGKENVHKHQRTPLKEVADNRKETPTCLSNSLKDGDTDGFWLAPVEESLENNEMDNEGPEKETACNLADMNGFWLAPAEASLKDRRHSVVGEMDSLLDVESSAGNSAKSAKVIGDRPVKESSHNLQDIHKTKIADSPMETLICPSNSLQFAGAADTNVIVSKETMPVHAGLLAEKNPSLALHSRCVVDAESVLPDIHRELEEDDNECSSLVSKHNSNDVYFYESFSESVSEVVSSSEISGENHCNRTKELKEVASKGCSDMRFQKQIMSEQSRNVKLSEQRHSKTETGNSMVKTNNQLPSSSVCSRGNATKWQEWKAAQLGDHEVSKDKNLKDVHLASAGVQVRTEDHRLAGAMAGTNALPTKSSSEELAPVAVVARGRKFSSNEKDISHSSASDSSSFFDVINTTSSFLLRSSIPGLDLIDEPLGDSSSVREVLNFANQIVSAWKDREIKSAQNGKREQMDTNTTASLISTRADGDLGEVFQQGVSTLEGVCSRADQKIPPQQESTGVLNDDKTSSLHSSAAPSVHRSEAKQEFSAAFFKDSSMECRESEIPAKAKPVGISSPLVSAFKEQAPIANNANRSEEQISRKPVKNSPLAFLNFENVPLDGSCQRLENQMPRLFPQQPMQSQPRHTIPVHSENLVNRNNLMSIQQNSQHQAQFFPGRLGIVNFRTDHSAPYYQPGVQAAPSYVQPVPVFHQAAQLPPSFPFSPGQNFSGLLPRQHLPQFQQSAGGIPFPDFPVGPTQRHSAIGIVSPMVHGTAVHGGTSNSNFGTLPSSPAPLNTVCHDGADVNHKQNTSGSASGSDVYLWFSDILTGKRSSSSRDGEPNAKVPRVAVRESNFRSGSPVVYKSVRSGKHKTSYPESSDSDISDDCEKIPSCTSTKCGQKMPSSSKSRTKYVDTDDWMDMSGHSDYRKFSYSKTKSVQNDSGSLSDVSSTVRDGHSRRSSTASDYAGSDSSYRLSRPLKDVSDRTRRTTKHSRSKSSSDFSDSEKSRSSRSTRKKRKRIDPVSSRSRSSSGTRTKMKHSESKRLGRDREKLDSLKGSSRGSSKDVKALTNTSRNRSSISVVNHSESRRRLQSSRNKSILDALKISDAATKADMDGAKMSRVGKKKGNTTSTGSTTGEVLTSASKENGKEPISGLNRKAASVVFEKSVMISDSSVHGESNGPATQLDRLHISGSSKSKESVNGGTDGSDISELGIKWDSKRISRWDQKNKVSEINTTSKEEENGDLDGFAHELLEAEMESKASDFIVLPASDIATAIISLEANSDKHSSKGQEKKFSSSMSKQPDKHSPKGQVKKCFSSVSKQVDKHSLKGQEKRCSPSLSEQVDKHSSEGQEKRCSSSMSKQVENLGNALCYLKAYKGMSRSNSSDSEESIDWKKVLGDNETKSVVSPQSSGSFISIVSDTSLEALKYAREKILMEMKKLESEGEDQEGPECQTSEEISTLGTDVPDLEGKVREEDRLFVTRSSPFDSFAENKLKPGTEKWDVQKQSTTKKSCFNLEKSQTDVGCRDIGHQSTSERPHTRQPDGADGVYSKTGLQGISQNQHPSYFGSKVHAQNEDGAVISRSKHEYFNSSTITEKEMSSATDMILKRIKIPSLKDQTGSSCHNIKASDDPTCSPPNNRNNDEKRVDNRETSRTKSVSSPLEEDDARKVWLKEKSLIQGGQMWSDMLMSERAKYTPVESLQQNRKDVFLAYQAEPSEKPKSPQHITSHSLMQGSRDGRESLQVRLKKIFKTVELSSGEKNHMPRLLDNFKKTHDAQGAEMFLPQHSMGVPKDISETSKVIMNKDAHKAILQKPKMLHKPEPVGGLMNTLHMSYEQHLETFTVDQIETELGLIQECSNLLEAMQKKQMVDQFENSSNLSADSTLEGSQKGQLLIQRSCLSRAAYFSVRESLSVVASDFENTIRSIEKGSAGGCHQCVPKTLLLPDEFDKLNTKEGAVLILLKSIPHRQYLRLQQLQEDIVESVVRSQQFAIQNNTFGIIQEKLRQKQLRAERSTLLTTFTGRFNLKRLLKLKSTLSHYDNCQSHLNRVLGKESLSKMSFFLSVHQAVMRHFMITEGETRDSADVENL